MTVVLLGTCIHTLETVMQCPIRNDDKLMLMEIVNQLKKLTSNIAQRDENL